VKEGEIVVKGGMGRGEGWGGGDVIILRL